MFGPNSIRVVIRRGSRNSSGSLGGDSAPSSPLPPAAAAAEPSESATERCTSTAQLLHHHHHHHHQQQRGEGGTGDTCKEPTTSSSAPIGDAPAARSPRLLGGFGSGGAAGPSASRLGAKPPAAALAALGCCGDTGGVDGGGSSNSVRSAERRAKWRRRLLMRDFPGAKVPEALLCVLLGIVLNFAAPRPAALTRQAWALASIFAATILGLVLEPLPVAPVALCGAVAALWTGTLTYAQAFAGYQSDTIWLILGAFFFAKGVEVTGLGARVADLAVLALGHSALGLAYALALAELALALCMPSTTARAAGVFVPIVTSLAASYGSEPRSKSSGRLGTFLCMSQAQVSSATSCMFYLGGAQTPVALDLAAKQGVAIDSPFDTYLKGAVVPSAVLVALIPLVVYYLPWTRPEVRRTPWARAEARERLRQRGRPRWRECTVLVVLLGAVALWISSSRLPFRLSNASVALLGVVVLLAFGAVTWDDLAGHRAVWDMLVWLPVLFGMCGALADMGVVRWASDSVARPLLAAGVPREGLFVLLCAIYCALHYGVASQTAHVTALYPAFLGIMVDAGVDGRMAALALAYVTNLLGGLTHYASAQAAAYYSAGFYSVATNCLVGFLVGFGGLGLFLGIGAGWWRAVGLWA